MAYKKNVSVLQNNNLSLSGSVVTVTGSLYGSFMSGTISDFTEVNAQYIDLAYDGEPTHETGRLYYDTSSDVFAYDTEINGVAIQPGRELAVRVKNDSGGTLNKGKIVRIISGSSNSDTPNVSTASYESEYSSADTLAMMMNDTDDTDTGYALLYGVLTHINTNAYSVGDMLYLSSSGDFTTTVPQSPLHEVRIGQVVRSATNGTIYVKIQNGYEADELHDVLFSSKAEGDLISWDATTGVWRNKKQLTGSYEVTGDITASNAQFTTITADTITAREYHTELVSASVIYQSGSTKFGDDANDVHQFSGSIRQSGSVDNYFLGSLAVGDSNPASYKLYVNGTSRFADSSTFLSDVTFSGLVRHGDNTIDLFNSGDMIFKTGYANGDFVFRDLSNNSLLFISQSGDVGIGTTSPSKKLHVYQGSDGEIRFEGGSSTEAKLGVVGGTPFVGSNGSLKILSSNTQAVLIDSSQNILIGSSGSPTADLHLYRTSGDADLRVETTTAGQDSTMNLVCANSTTSTAHIRFYNGNNWYAGALLDSTNFAIGESSTYGTDTHLVVNTAGNVGIGTTSPGANLDVSGSTIFGRLSSDTHEFSGSVNVSGTLTATAKSFDIEHPTKEGMRLRYGSLEGPENGVYVRGTTTESVIELPEHWTGLVDEETITVNLTPYGTSQQLWVKKIEDNKVHIGGKLKKCFFTVFGERKDIDKLTVEY